MPAALPCHYYDAGVCRSCTFLDVPYAEQLARKQARAEQLLVPFLVTCTEGTARWLDPWANTPGGFRNRAKMVVGGSRGAPTLGILDEAGRGVDLRECPLHDPVIVDALPHLARFVADAGLIPYDVPGRQGELKHVLTTASPDGELMVRFVLRSTDQLRRLQRHLPQLQEALPHARVVSANILPEHKAVLEGEREIHLAGDETLTMRTGGLDLHLRPQGFFQTSTAAAAALYQQAAAWVVGGPGGREGSDDEAGSNDGADRAGALAGRPAWDLYCGVGGFGLHLARATDADPAARTSGARDAGRPANRGMSVIGVETSEEAVRAARRTAEAHGLDATFHAGDATQWARAQFARVAAGEAEEPGVVIVNPPRRGIGAELSGLLEEAGVAGTLRRIVYSSCNVESLVKDLAAMPTWRVRQGRVVDMFPHTGHMEVMVDLVRARADAASAPQDSAAPSS